MFVIVYLKDAKKQIIIPQEWIMDLDQEALNNQGKNSNQNRRIFYSRIGNQVAPNFNLVLSKEFPPFEINETCYIGRIKRFCGKCKLEFIIIIIVFLREKWRS